MTIPTMMEFPPDAASGLEALPVEIQSIVLHAVPDPQTLLHLIIASRKYNETYYTYRRTVLPAVVIRDFANKRIFSNQSVHWMEVCIGRRNPARSGLPDAILAYYSQARAGSEVQMTYEQCLSLLALKDARTWGSKYPRYRGGSVFRSRRLVSSDKYYNTRDREFSFLGVEKGIPKSLKFTTGSKTYAW